MGGTRGVVLLSAARKPAKRTRKSPQELLDAVQERLDATPERLARAREAGQTPTRDADRTRRIIDPFDAMRANRVLAPHDPKLNDIRWLVGESLRRTHQRARLDQLRAVALKNLVALLGAIDLHPVLHADEVLAEDAIKAAIKDWKSKHETAAPQETSSSGSDGKAVRG